MPAIAEIANEIVSALPLEGVTAFPVDGDETERDSLLSLEVSNMRFGSIMIDDGNGLPRSVFDYVTALNDYAVPPFDSEQLGTLKTSFLFTLLGKIVDVRSELKAGIASLEEESRK